ncbi:MAG TPA: hypothetical protein DCS12_04835 [Clostridiales bacterium]|nr:hypothetical protein [Clostridiales bacterium]
MIGKKLSPILLEIEQALNEFEYYKGTKPEFTNEALRAATKIFMSVLMDKMFDLQIKEKMTHKSAYEMATVAGEELRRLIKIYTDIDTHELFKIDKT